MNISKLIKNVKDTFKCTNCTFACKENTFKGDSYFYDKGCCPKDFPLTIWLRYNAGWKFPRKKGKT